MAFSSFNACMCRTRSVRFIIWILESDRCKAGLDWAGYVMFYASVPLLIRKHNFIPDECKPRDTSRDSGLSNTGKCNRVVWNHFFQHHSDANQALLHFSRCSTAISVHLQLCYKCASWIHWACVQIKSTKGQDYRSLRTDEELQKLHSVALLHSSAQTLTVNIISDQFGHSKSERHTNEAPGRLDSQLMPIQVMQYCNKHINTWHTQYELYL